MIFCFHGIKEEKSGNYSITQQESTNPLEGAVHLDDFQFSRYIKGEGASKYSITQE